MLNDFVDAYCCAGICVVEQRQADEASAVDLTDASDLTKICKSDARQVQAASAEKIGSPELLNATFTVARLTIAIAQCC